MFQNRFTKWHFVIYLVYLIAFGGMTFWAMSAQSGANMKHTLWTTSCTALGPLVGAIARNCQSCCLSFSLWLLPYCGTCLALGALAQVIRFPFRRFEMPVRYVLWTTGLFGWFAGIPLSFAHAFG